MALLCLCALICSSLEAQEKPPEYAVKAAYLFNFGKFTKWPTENSTFNICVLGRDPFNGSLDRTVAGDAIDGRPIRVRRMTDASHVNECQILFLSSSEHNRVESLVAQVQSKPILTVSDMPDFVERGGMIQFELVNDRVRFTINLRAAREAKLNLSSDLLVVASRVENK